MAKRTIAFRKKLAKHTVISKLRRLKGELELTRQDILGHLEFPDSLHQPEYTRSILEIERASVSCHHAIIYLEGKS